MVAPLFERQQAFNSALVDHINRNIAMHRETTRALEATIAMLRDDHQRFIEYQTLLILYAQQITPYVDTKDRHVAGLMHGLAAGLSGLSDELQKRWESMVARERRYDAQVSDVRTTLSVMQRAVQTLKRELETGLVRQRATGATGATGAKVRRCDGSAGANGALRSLDSYKYVGFEDQFRGSQHDIRERVAAYVPLFEGASDVLDVGCGRGEFLELLRGEGHFRARDRSERRDGRGVPRARPRRHGGRRAQLSAGAARRIARRALRGAGRRAPRAGLPDAVSRGRLSQAAARVENRARNDQPRVLVCVLLELHPRHHACPAAASRHAAVFRERQRLSERRRPLQRAVSRRGQAPDGAELADRPDGGPTVMEIASTTMSRS